MFVGLVIDGREFEPPVRHHSFVETDREIFLTVILSLPLIQDGKSSITSEKKMALSAS